MTQEDKELLLKDLCARLPYGVICKSNSYRNILFNSSHISLIESEEIKPYLRPLSSMTEEEKRDLSSKYNWNIKGNDISIRYHSEGYWDDDTECPTNEYLKLFDWLNANHFDYRGLIDLGLALVATEGMYE